MVERVSDKPELGRFRSLGRSVRQLIFREHETQPQTYLDHVKQDSSLGLDIGELRGMMKPIEISEPNYVLSRPELDYLNAAGLLMSLVGAATKAVLQEFGPNARDEFFVSIWDPGETEELLCLSVHPSSSTLNLGDARYELMGDRLSRLATDSEGMIYGEKPVEPFTPADVKAFHSRLNECINGASTVFIGFPAGRYSET